MDYEEIGPVAPDEYRCDLCGGIYGKGWSDEEATAEMQENFGTLAQDDQVVVCDDCYQQMIARIPPKLAGKFTKDW